VYIGYGTLLCAGEEENSEKIVSKKYFKEYKLIVLMCHDMIVFEVTCSFLARFIK